MARRAIDDAIHAAFTQGLTIVPSQIGFADRLDGELSPVTAGFFRRGESSLPWSGDRTLLCRYIYQEF
ncbi:MAG: hypothetical protein LBU46_01410 [Candidatus Accumulibacter sp.]|nr:hypothetical protein [Accumulibacter sp.]